MQRVIGWLARRFDVDTLAYALYSIATCLPGFMFEKWVMGSSIMQIVWVRVGYNLVKYLLGKVPAWLKDRLRKRFGCGEGLSFKRAMADGAALSIYQIPIYVFFYALLAHVPIEKVGMMVVFYLINNQSLGWIYGVIDDWLRNRLAAQVTET